ncbi:MAG: hypothetical protein AXA67_00300 [Methylothermaceae bacteria B42]|nr:MAG: hypothetical protein AXA67_00300 [Methylothermaceae bacteria B42]
MSRCPACNARLGEAALCRRCGCDLSLSRKARLQARLALSHALKALDHHQTEEAERWLQQALMWNSSDWTIKVAGFIKTQLSLS